jgi:tRNA (guanine-N7-)-methyltransferase
MENPARTAEHLERIKNRDTSLRSVCGALLSSGRAFVWEVGCGHGHFLAAYAAAHPDRLCVGIDLSAERIGRAERKRSRAGLANLHFIQAEAGAFLEALPESARITEIYVLFPDPWPKRRHHKNRLMQETFMKAVAARAGEGARLYFRTDDESYFTYTEGVVKGLPSWRLAAEAWPFEFPTVFQERAPSHRSLVAVRTFASP